MKKNEALEFVKDLDYFIGKKAYTINGGDFTIHDFYADLQTGSENQFDVYVNLIPRLQSVAGNFKKETFNLFKSTYAISELIELKVELMEGAKRLCLYIPDGFDYDFVQFFTVGNKSFPQKSIVSFPVNEAGLKCEIFEISSDLKRFTKAESGRLWASLNSYGIKYISNPLSFAKINAI
ncbi:hypothetical protein CNR22_14930 [Sphingobacteriaceae bacterium]|nr:hypothetical protein CNR22_14930 [Sphingobacteriaceae bacterium]